MEFIPVFFIFGVFWGVIARAIGKGKGREGFWWGFWLGPIGLIVVAVMEPDCEYMCQHCGGQIAAGFSRCRHCGGDLRVPEGFNEEVATKRPRRRVRGSKQSGLKDRTRKSTGDLTEAEEREANEAWEALNEKR